MKIRTSSPPFAGGEAFKKSIERGGKDSPAYQFKWAIQNDLPLAQAVYRNRRARALRMGIEIWEYRGVKMFHTKAMVIDGHISAIGSYNLDKLSHKHNSEVMVWVDDLRLAGEHGPA